MMRNVEAMIYAPLAKWYTLILKHFPSNGREPKPVLLQKIWKESDGREAFFLASFTLPLETSWGYMQLDR